MIHFESRVSDSSSIPVSKGPVPSSLSGPNRFVVGHPSGSGQVFTVQWTQDLDS